MYKIIAEQGFTRRERTDLNTFQFSRLSDAVKFVETTMDSIHKVTFEDNQIVYIGVVSGYSSCIIIKPTKEGGSCA